VAAVAAAAVVVVVAAAVVVAVPRQQRERCQTGTVAARHGDGLERRRRR
jgi:hypothetical protein